MKNADEIARMQTLFNAGWSKRKIAAHLKISRNTLDRYLNSQISQSGPVSADKTKHNLCLEWLQLQDLSGEENSESLRQKLKAERKIQISHHEMERAIQQWRHNRGRQIETCSNSSGNTLWRIGPYHFSAAAGLHLGGLRIEMPAAQTQLLLLLVQHANQLVGAEEIARQLWPGQSLGAHWRRNVSLCVHRLRQVFAMGPLGGSIIRSVYQKGYVLSTQVRTCTATSPRKRTPRQRCSDMLLDNPFYGEAHDYWANRDPYKLHRQEWLLQKSVNHNPSFEQGYLELCYFQILQCFWGMRASQEVLPDLQQLLTTVDAFTRQPAGWLGIKAEVQSLLLWQPHTTERLYGTWLADTLPRGMPLFAWARHLIFTGKPQTALNLLKAHINTELCQGWLVLAMAYLAAGDVRAAEAAIQAQLSLDSTMVSTRLLFALLRAQGGQSAQATQQVLETGILDRPFQGVKALAAYSLARGTLQQLAHQLLNEAMDRIERSPSHEGALAYWGLAALALERPTDAIHLLKLSVDKRCYSAPVLFSTHFLKSYAHTPACRLFDEKMRAAFPVLF
jgi:DNA-binding winged helix-turn-helix (wHTH) protein